MLGRSIVYLLALFQQREVLCLARGVQLVAPHEEEQYGAHDGSRTNEPVLRLACVRRDIGDVGKGQPTQNEQDDGNHDQRDALEDTHACIFLTVFDAVHYESVARRLVVVVVVVLPVCNQT